MAQIAHQPALLPPTPSALDQRLQLTGYARLVLVLDLSRFVPPNDQHLFRHLRGSEGYASALRAIKPHAPFRIDERATSVEQGGYALRIFRSRLVYNHFFPTYRVSWDASVRARLAEHSCNDIIDWQHCDARLRLTRNGLAVVILERQLEDLPLPWRHATRTRSVVAWTGTSTKPARSDWAPSYEPEAARQLLEKDCSTRTDELCIFTGESALIYRPLQDESVAYLGGPQGLASQAYATYWAAIERGVKHMVAFRSEAQQAERRTTELLGAIPALTGSVQSGRLSSAETSEVEHMATGLSDIFDSLPEQRSQLVSATAFRADYARQKFERLLTELDVPRHLNW